MKLKVAPIIHARTREVDFRSELLVVPEDFDRQATQWARTYIIDSTSSFELSGADGRRAAFCNGQYVVNGLSIRIGDLYRLCGKPAKYDTVNGTRANYGFIGFVLHKKDLLEPFDIPYSAFLDVYETYMALRWEDSVDKQSSLRHTSVPYTMQEFPKAAEVFSITEKKPKMVLSERVASRESMVAGTLLRMCVQEELAYCSDIPGAKSARESRFHIVSAMNADAIQAAIGKSVQSSPSPTARQSVKVSSGLDEMKELIERSNNRTKISGNGASIFFALLGALLILLSVLAQKGLVFLFWGIVCLLIAGVMALVRATGRK